MKTALTIEVSFAVSEHAEHMALYHHELLKIIVTIIQAMFAVLLHAQHLAMPGPVAIYWQPTSSCQHQRHSASFAAVKLYNAGPTERRAMTEALFCNVQVMADAADLCCHTLVHHCPSQRLLKPLADALCTDRNVKLRQCSAKYMLQVSLNICFAHAFYTDRNATPRQC